MDNSEILQVVDVVSAEKGVAKEVIFEAIEAALAAARRKLEGNEADYRVSIDRATGDYDTVRCWVVIADDQEPGEEPDSELALSEARQKKPDAVIGDSIEEPVERVAFGRIATQMAKQVIVQKVRDAEREKVAEAFGPRVGQMMTGQVKRLDRGSVVLDMGGNAEAVIPKDRQIPRENIRMGDRVSFLLEEVSTEPRGPQLIASRTAPKLLAELFQREVPEVKEGLVQILGAARDAGVRAKIAVRSREARIDPIGACVGMHGTRVQSVSNELAGERIDIILADENPAQFVINALSPAKVVSITMDEETHAMDVAVHEDQLSLAIGRGGQNVRLASQLTGWELNIMTEADAENKLEAEAQNIRQLFIDQLHLDEGVADILVQEGFSTVEEVAYVPESELLAIEEFDEEIVEELRSRAQDVLITREISREEQLDKVEPAQDLLEMEGMSARLAYLLAGRGIITRDDLAEQSVDELLEVEGMEPDFAGELIMQARAAWFDDGDEEDAA